MYDQMSSLRYIERRLSPLLPIFAAHYRVLGMLKRLNSHLVGHNEVSQDAGAEFTTALDSLHAKVQSFESNAKYLLARVDSTIQTVDCPQYDEIPPLTVFQASDTISLKSQNTTEAMSHHMLRDSTAIRVITLVTLVYLPASFVAVSHIHI